LKTAAPLLACRSGRTQPPPKQAAVTSSVMLWTLPGTLEEKLEQAARAGIQSVELGGEHLDWDGPQLDRFLRLAQSFRLKIDSVTAIPYARMDEFSMVNPARREAMLAELKRNIERAKRLECPAILLLTGKRVKGLSREDQWKSLVDNCKRCGDLVEEAGLKAVVEPLNDKIETPGYFLTTVKQGVKLMRETAHPSVGLVFDIYHEQVQTGNIIDTIREAADYTRIYHVADNPGRHEPGTGELNYPNIYRAIGKTGFHGHIAMEFRPTGDPVATLIGAVDEMREALAEA